jgi:uncharacterized protein (DUF1778 family)
MAMCERERVEELEKRVETLEEQMRRVLAKLNLPPEPEDEGDQLIKRNDVGEYSVKVVYPGWYRFLDKPVVGFPRNRRKLAKRIQVGQKMFIYVTSPEKAIVALARVTKPMREDPNPNSKWPYLVDLEFEIRPKLVGVQFADVGINIRPRVGDTLYSLDPAKAQEIIELLNKQPDLDEEQLQIRLNRYKDIE